MEKGCMGLENSCLRMEKSGKMLEKLNSIVSVENKRDTAVAGMVQ